MLTLPDFVQKKIVFISERDNLPNELKFGNSNLLLYKNGQKINQMSCHLILAVFIIGNFTISNVLIKKAKEYGISLFLLNSSFETYAQILSQAEGNYLLREKQYHIQNMEVLCIAKLLIKNKISNQFQVLKDFSKIDSQSEKLTQTLLQIEKAESIDSIRGLEGDFAHFYFKTLFQEIGWYRRAPRTKEDITNLLLDIGYTFIFNISDAILNLFGFDTYKGFYHQLFFQRKSLSCDVMEPMRPLIDKTLLKAYHLKQIEEKDFIFKNGAFSFRSKKGLAEKYTQIFFQTIMNHKDLIYVYLQSFYRYLMDNKKYPFPLFKF